MRLMVKNEIELTCAAECPTVAMLRPRSGQAQWVLAERYEIAPWTPATEYLDTYGNLCQRFTLPEGAATLRVETEINVTESLAVEPEAVRVPVDQLPDDTLVYLLQSRYCPADKAGDRAQEIVGSAKPGYQQAERITHWIHENLRYEYGVSDQTTDAFETLEHGAGVCRDFAHVGVMLCRALQIPARFVAGYLHELDPMDMHAWFEAFVGGRWYTFDATQDQPRGGRVVVSYGRDAADVAFLSNYGPMEVAQMRVSVERLDDPHA